jgi:nucleotide-binding universal stress UspA family protein
VLKLLLAVDGSESATRATRSGIEAAGQFRGPVEIELLTVQQPGDEVPSLGLSREVLERYCREAGEKALAPSRELLGAAGVKYTARVLFGDPARTIVDHAQSAGCQMIYMGTRGMTPIAGLVLGSVSTKVLHLARIPVALSH